MQKFLRILIIISLFFICLLLGAKWADITLIGNENIVINPDTQHDDQKKILIFVVDRFDKKNPELLSVWSVVIYYQDAKGITLIPISIEKGEPLKEIKRSFVLTADKDLHVKTIKYMNTKYKSKWDTYLILDNFSANYLLGWITNNAFEVVSTEPSDGYSHIENMCNIISENKLSSIDTLDWPLITPDHLKTNLSIESIRDLWENLLGEEQILCEVIR